MTTKHHETHTRPDADIAKDVVRRMKADIEVPDNRIHAKVADGVVTLSGTVGHDEQKQAAESCARRVEGVRSIYNLVLVDAAAAVSETD